MNKKTYIVTGGAGFIGSNLVATLQKRDPTCKLIVIDNFSSGSFLNILEACKRNDITFNGCVLTEDIQNVKWRDVISKYGPHTIFHLAAITDTTEMNQEKMLKANSDSFYSLFDACAISSVPIVYASSAATYGDIQGKKPFKEEQAGSPMNVYGFSKWSMEKIHENLNSMYKPRPYAIGLRYFNVFGPGESRKREMASMIYKLADQMTNGEPPVIFENGEQERDQVYVDDVVECTIKASEIIRINPEANGVYNVGSGTPTSFNRIIEIMGSVVSPTLSRQTTYKKMPPNVKKFYQNYTCANMKKTEEVLGFKPKCNIKKSIEKYFNMIAEGKEK